jgi:hypothetical protein
MPINNVYSRFVFSTKKNFNTKLQNIVTNATKLHLFN